MNNGTSSLINLHRKLDLANDAIKRLQKKIVFFQSIKDRTLNEINLYTESQEPYHFVHNEYETRVRQFESTYWLSLFDICERTHRGHDDPSATLSVDEFITLETDRNNFLHSISTIAPDIHDYYPIEEQKHNN